VNDFAAGKSLQPLLQRTRKGEAPQIVSADGNANPRSSLRGRSDDLRAQRGDIASSMNVKRQLRIASVEIRQKYGRAQLAEHVQVFSRTH
jgi:hypothetical protein